MQVKEESGLKQCISWIIGKLMSLKEEKDPIQENVVRNRDILRDDDSEDVI